ncbi:unnamed protein product [Prorocentrum cordatum]|uniref:Uncharacterized protein n=1 Tax=Prorocentrum cordatum TaxID=2364126 RepID=A0ABN9PTH5_9DINO|nr:unnamed protein product [Polarella glacialis]
MPVCRYTNNVERETNPNSQCNKSTHAHPMNADGTKGQVTDNLLTGQENGLQALHRRKCNIIAGEGKDARFLQHVGGIKRQVTQDRVVGTALMNKLESQRIADGTQWQET